jgi:four helix bundle protein
MGSQEGEMATFQELIVWQKAHALTLAVYQATRDYPREELFALTNQTRRAAISVPANVAEGHGRRGSREFRFFMNTALGSATELQYHLILGRDLGYIPKPEWAHLDAKTVEVIKLCKAWLAKLDLQPE